MAGSCKYCNEPSGYINCGELLEQLRTCQLFKKDCSMELVSGGSFLIS